MEISISNNIVTIDGNIKTVTDYQELKKNIDPLVKSNKNIEIILRDSISITSSVIGYFNKLVLKDKIELKIAVASELLFELFKDLNLVELFRVRKI